MDYDHGCPNVRVVNFKDYLCPFLKNFWFFKSCVNIVVSNNTVNLHQKYQVIFKIICNSDFTFQNVWMFIWQILEMVSSIFFRDPWMKSATIVSSALLWIIHHNPLIILIADIQWAVANLLDIPSNIQGNSTHLLTHRQGYQMLDPRQPSKDHLLAHDHQWAGNH